jgi:hypothetical protein
MSFDIATFFVSIAGSLASVWAAIKFVPEKVADKAIGHVFNKRLERFKHEQQREIEGLKTKLSYISDRGVRSNEREYNSTVELWEAVVRAFLATRDCIIQFTESPDLNTLPEQRIRTFMGVNGFGEDDIQSILEADDKNQRFGRVVAARTINAAREQTRALRLKVYSTIFVPEEIENDVLQLVDLMIRAEVVASLRFRGLPADVQWDGEFIQKGEPAFRALKEKLRIRLLKVADGSLA